MDRRHYRRENQAEVVDTMKPIFVCIDRARFTTNGIGILADAASCVVIEERNGSRDWICSIQSRPARQHHLPDRR